MNDSLTFGLLMVALGGALEGLFSIPVTKTPRWSFEKGLAATARWYRENPEWWRPLKHDKYTVK